MRHKLLPKFSRVIQNSPLFTNSDAAPLKWTSGSSLYRLNVRNECPERANGVQWERRNELSWTEIWGMFLWWDHGCLGSSSGFGSFSVHVLLLLLSSWNSLMMEVFPLWQILCVFGRLASGCRIQTQSSPNFYVTSVGLFVILTQFSCGCFSLNFLFYFLVLWLVDPSGSNHFHPGMWKWEQ